MLQYKKGRFYCEGVSFEIPENFFYDTNIDLMFDNGMEFISPDEKITVELALDETDDTTKEELELSVSGDSYIIVDPISPITINGLKGHHCYYHDKRENMYEVRLKISKEFQFVFCIRSYERNVKDAMDEPEFKRILTEIRKD